MVKSEKIVRLKLDIIFKRIFGNANNDEIIKAFLSDMLDIPKESIKAIIINNVELTPEYIYQKFGKLDLRLNVDNRIVNIEIQVNSESAFKERTLFYWSKMYSDELREGDGYNELKQTICINIIDFILFDCDDCHSRFMIMEKDRHEVLTDIFSIHFFELKKINRSKARNRVEEWLMLINAETEEELMKIEKETTIPEIKKTIVKLRELSADEKIRQEVYYREKRLHDEVTAIKGAKAEGKKEGREEGKKEMIEKFIKKGYTEEEIREFYPDYSN